RNTEHAERAAWSFSLWRYAGLPSSARELSWRATFGRSLWREPELSLWPERAHGTPAPGMAVSDADCQQRAQLNCIASVSESSRAFDEEESQERIRRSDACQRQERNGEAAHGQIRARAGSQPSRWAKAAG